MQRQRGAGAKGVDKTLHGTVERLRRDAGVEITQLLQRPVVQRLGQQEKSPGRAQAQPRHGALQAAGVVVQAQPRRRHAQFHTLHADAEVAGQRQVRGTAVDAAVQARHGGLRQRRQRVGHALEGLRAGVDAIVAQLAQVVAGAEGAAAAGQHQHAHRRVPRHLGQLTLQRDQVLPVQAVQVLRPLQGQPRHAVRAELQPRRPVHR